MTLIRNLKITRNNTVRNTVRFNAVIRKLLVSLYGLVYVFSLLDIITTKYGLAGGGVEQNRFVASLFGAFGFGGAMLIKFAEFAVVIAASEIALWQLNKRELKEPKNVALAKKILVVGWITMLIILFVVVLNNFWVLTKLGIL